MAITATYQNNKEQASCVCDVCNTEIFINCQHGSLSNTPTKRGNSTKPKDEIRNSKTVIQQLSKQGWKIYQKEVVCETCLEKRVKEKKLNNKKSTVEPIRQPTRNQKREIMLLLQDVYDVDKQHYKQAETDHTVAETLGDGILWGWVSQIREDVFGPDGNEADMLTVGEAKLWMARADEHITSFEKRITDLQRTLTNIQAVRKDVNDLLIKMQKATN